MKIERISKNILEITYIEGECDFVEQYLNKNYKEDSFDVLSTSIIGGQESAPDFNTYVTKVKISTKSQS